MLVCEDPATKPDCTARAFSTVHLNWPVFVAPEEKVFPVPRFGLRGQAFSCWNAGRKQARTGSEHVKNKRKAWIERTVGEKTTWPLLNWPWPVLEKPCGPHQVGHNKSPTNGRRSICRGIRLCKFRFARCQPGEHPPISICFGLFFGHTQGTKMLFHLILFFRLPSEEVPRHSQTRRDQVGTSNWVEALQILTHLLI